MSDGLSFGRPVVYQGTEHAELRGQSGIVLEVLSPRLIMVTFDLPDGRKPVLNVPPEDVGISEGEAAQYLHPGTSRRRQP